MAGAVHEEALLLVFLDQCVHLALEQAQFDQALGQHSSGDFMRARAGIAGLEFGRRCFLCRQHHVVHRFLRPAEFAVGRKTARDVGGVALVLAARVNQHQIAVLERCVVLNVMQDAGVGAGPDDAAVTRFHAFQLELVMNFRRQLIFEATGFGEFHRAHVAARGHRAGVLHQFQLGGGLDQTLLVQRAFQRHKLRRSHGAAPRHFANLAHRGGDLRIQLRMLAEREIHALAAAEQRRQHAGKFGNVERLVRSIFLRSTFGPGAVAVPDLSRRVARTHEQQVLALGPAGREHRDGVRLRESREIAEIAVLAEAVMRIARADHFARGGHDGDAIRPHRLHQTRTARGVFVELNNRRSGHKILRK